MSSDFPYANVPSKLPELLDKIRSIGIPPTVTTKWLESIGFKSSNHRGMLKVLSFINFIDSSNSPTDHWKGYRGKDAKTVLAKAIRSGYSELFDTYPDANLRNDTDLEHYFSTRSTAGKQVVTRLVRTFKTLCELADFEKNPASSVIESEQSSPEKAITSQLSTQMPAKMKKIEAISHIEPQFTFNIQVVLPENASSETYDNIFKSISVHLLGRGDG